MAFPPAPVKDEAPAMEFQSMSDQEFARLSTEEKFRHIHLGMLELSRTLAELHPAMPKDGPLGE